MHSERTAPAHSSRLGAMLTGLALLALLLSTGCNSLEITPPKPTKLAKAGRGAAGVVRPASNKKKKDKGAAERVRSPEEEARLSLNRMLREFDDEIDAWRNAYATKDPSVYLIERSLTERAEEEFELLRDTAQGANVPFAMVAALALAFANREDTVPLLTDLATGDRDARVEANAVNGLGILSSRNPLARQQIDSSAVAQLLGDSRLEIRRAASFLASTMMRRGEDHGLLPYLAERTTDSDYMVRANACWAVGRAALPGSAGLLGVALQSDPTPEVRCNAAIALAATADKEAVDLLIRGLGDEDAAVRRHSAMALATMTGQRFGQSAERWTQWWTANRATFQPRIIEDEQAPAVGASVEASGG